MRRRPQKQENNRTHVRDTQRQTQTHTRTRTDTESEREGETQTHTHTVTDTERERERERGRDTDAHTHTNTDTERARVRHTRKLSHGFSLLSIILNSDIAILQGQDAPSVSQASSQSALRAYSHLTSPCCLTSFDNSRSQQLSGAQKTPSSACFAKKKQKQHENCRIGPPAKACNARTWLPADTASFEAGLLNLRGRRLSFRFSLNSKGPFGH